MTEANAFNENDARSFYEWLDHHPDEFTEVRIIPLPIGPVIQKFVQNEEDFIQICKEWSGKRQVYAGINPRTHQGGSKEDVSRVVGIPFDVDSEHPKNLGATDGELAKAKERMTELVSWIRGHWFKSPLINMSGNGYHTIQKVDLELNEKLPGQLESYFHEAVPNGDLDSIFDLPRIIKVPGTLSVKGRPTKERPHRLSRIVEMGDREADSQLAEHIRGLKSYTTIPKPQTGAGKTIFPNQLRTGGLKTCFKRFAEEGGSLSEKRSEDHLLRLALVAEAHFRRYSRDQIVDLFRKADDFNDKITVNYVNRQLSDISVKGIKTWGCPAIYRHHGCIGESCSRFKKQIAKHVPTTPPDPDEEVSPDQFFDKRGRFIPTYLVDYILIKTGKKHLLTPTTEKGGDIIWRYHPSLGIFKPNGISYIEKQAKHYLKNKTKKYMIAEVVKLTQIETYIERDQFDEDPDIIVLENGVYHYDTDELTEHSPIYHAKSKLPINFRMDAKCPAILKFIGEVIPDHVDVFQEWVGYHLIKQYLWAKILILVGDGENGKSKLLRLLEAFLGKNNFANVELYELITNRFKKAELYGKLANIAPDLGSEELKYTGRLKSFTGDDYVEAAKKHQHPFRFNNYAKLSFSTNKLPVTPDRSRAFYRRWLILTCPNVFTGKNCDPHILDKITTPEELSGMFNWALEGMRRLIKQGEFSDHKTAEETQEFYEELMDPVTAFVNNCVSTEKADAVIVKDDFYKAYYQFCRMRGFTSELKQTFTKQIKPQIINLRESQRTIRRKSGVHCWIGVSMKSNGEYCKKCKAHQICEGKENNGNGQQTIT